MCIYVHDLSSAGFFLELLYGIAERLILGSMMEDPRGL